MSSDQICGYISLLYSVADKPLDLWSKHVSLGGQVRRVSDETLHGDKVIEILGPHNSVIPTSITTPAKIVDTLNIRLAVLVLVIKNLKSHFKLEIQITDKNQHRRRFSFMTYNLEKLPSVSASLARVPLKLEECWNTLEINLQTLCRVAYGTDYEALQRMIVYPNCRLRRVYLQDRHYDRDEMPVELCNAFFDTFMSKWRINFVEQTCQTEEHYTGSLREGDSNLLANKTTVLPTKADLSKDADNADKSGNLNELGAIGNLRDSKTVKRNYVSLGVLNDEAKMHNNQNGNRRNWSLSKSLMNEAVVGSKLKEINKNEQGNRNKGITHETANSSTKFNNYMYLASSIGTSQFLKMHVDKTLFRNKPEFPKRLYPYRIRDSKDTSAAQRNNVNSIMSTKFGISIANFPLASKPGLSGNIGFSYDKMYKDIIVSNDRRAKKNAEPVNGSRPLVTVEENVQDGYIPHLIRKEAKPDNVKPSNACLMKEKTVSDLMSARNLVSRKFFEKLRDKGLVGTWVELSTYNAINRRNSCSQQKLAHKRG